MQALAGRQLVQRELDVASHFAQKPQLFFVELGNRGGLERIISFIGVGVLLLVVGYFAPLPPRKAEPEQVNA